MTDTQTKATHTPGPWTFSDERETEDRWFGSIIAMSPGNKGVEIARMIGSPPYCNGEGVVNGHLIAAAPEQHELLVKFETVFAAWMITCDDDELLHLVSVGLRDMLNDVRTTIAKAGKGQT